KVAQGVRKVCRPKHRNADGLLPRLQQRWQIVPRQLNFCRVNYSSCFTGCRCDLRPPNVLKAALERRTGPVPLRTVPTTADGCHCSCHKAAYGEISFVQCWSCWRCWTGREAHGARRQHVQ
ncbi:unnamed protein product, partial [Effrenium voratum]